MHHYCVLGHPRPGPVPSSFSRALDNVFWYSMGHMRIALIQQRATKEAKENLARGIEAARRAAGQGAELVAFAELGFEWFHPQRPAEQPFPAALAQTIPGPTTEAFSKLACELGIVVVLNLYERDGHQTYDSSPVIDADGSILGVTRMLHITDYEGFHEQGYYRPGDRGVPVYRTRAGLVGVAICYDRHYPEVMRSLALQGAELVVVPQAGSLGEWPEGLYEAEIRVAAFQNGYYVALVNRVGPEELLTFGGASFVTDPNGVVIARADAARDQTLHADLDFTRIHSSHARTLFLRDRRPEIVPALLGFSGRRSDSPANTRPR